MAQFHHHPDGVIFVRTEAGTYTESPVNFASDLGTAYAGLPGGAKERLYEPGVRHFLDGEPQPLSWPDGDGYIAAFAALVEARAARLAPPVPSLSQVKIEAETRVNGQIEQAKVDARIIVPYPGMVAQYASNAFFVERWIAAGRPEEPDPEDYPTAEAERQGFTPAKSLAEMLETWETMWNGMNAANAAIMLARRSALEAIKAAGNTAGVEAALAQLAEELGG